jgi:RimJ/RimL family protein N-acetyltransferase
VRLTTARCVLRPVAARDLEPLHRLWSSAGVRRFLWDDEVIPIARAAAAIDQSDRLFREHRFGLWGADAANVDSVRVLEKLGFSLHRRQSVAGLDTVFYELRR